MKQAPRSRSGLAIQEHQATHLVAAKSSKVTQLLRNPRTWLAIALLGVVLLCFLSPLKAVFDQAFLVGQLQRCGSWGVFLFIVVYILLTIIGIPGTVLTVAGGAVFGLVWGTFWSVIGATLGAIGAFWTARYLLRDWAVRRFRQHPALIKFNQAVTHKPLNFVLAVRFAPISPFNVVNFLFGLTPICWIRYSIGTFVGIIPGTLAYTWLGVTGTQALQGGDRLPLVIALLFLTLLSVLPLWLNKNA